jgi:hypothetical protein
MAGHLMMLLVPSAASGPAVTVAEYLVVAGGGGGGEILAFGGLRGTGHGGAGGLLSGTTSFVRGVPVSVAVGNAASNSSIGEIESIAGGDGGSAGAENENGFAGGSGGGGAQAASGTTNGGAGTTGQGNAGEGGSTLGSGNGGGLSASSSITGEAVTYAVGGSSGVGNSPTANTGNGGRGGAIVAGDGIVVSGAGTAAANGTYQPDGEHNGRTQYRLGSTDYLIRWDTQVFERWSIDFASNGLYLLGAGGTPSGPATQIDGASPAPTISNEITTVAPTAGASGVVIIAYPDTLPALTVSGGLTYDQPTRAGYRVYRFTAGTGTITP